MNTNYATNLSEQFRREEEHAKELFQNCRREELGPMCQFAIQLFDQAVSRLGTWETSIFRGERTAELEEDFKAVFRQWVNFSTFLISQLDGLCASGSIPIKNLVYSGIRERRDEGNRILAKWLSPVPSQAIALRTRTLSVANDKRLEEILRRRAVAK